MTEINELALLVCDFCFSTIQGHESGIYKSLKMNMINLSLDTLRTNQMLGFFTGATMNYLNGAYVSLIKRNDTYIMEKFDAMCKISNHSVICLLNIIMVFIMEIHSSLDRSKLNISSYELYIKSVMSQLNSKYEESLLTLGKSLSHSCNGIDIKTCDPNKPLFFTK